MKTNFISFICVLAAFGLYSCDSDNSDKGTATVGFYLTDAPATEGVKSVNIDVQSITYSLDGEKWESLNVEPFEIDLLKFSNGKDYLLSNIQLEEGVKVQQIRLTLGDNNYLVLEDGTSVELKTPSAQQSGLKFNVHSVAELTSGYKTVIDFDAARSIVKQGNGTYSLKPVIRAYIEANTSFISGYIVPANEMMRVFTVTSQGDTISTLSDTTQNNFFMLHGLFSGSYDLKAQDLATNEILTIRSGLNLIGGTDMPLGEVSVE